MPPKTLPSPFTPPLMIFTGALTTPKVTRSASLGMLGSTSKSGYFPITTTGMAAESPSVSLMSPLILMFWSKSNQPAPVI